MGGEASARLPLAPAARLSFSASKEELAPRARASTHSWLAKVDGPPAAAGSPEDGEAPRDSESEPLLESEEEGGSSGSGGGRRRRRAPRRAEAPGEPLLTPQAGGAGEGFASCRVPSANSWLEHAAVPEPGSRRGSAVDCGGTGGLRGWPPPVPRDRANMQRCRARDEWNLCELRLQEAIQARGAALDEQALRRLGEDAAGPDAEAAPPPPELGWLVRLSHPRGSGVPEAEGTHRALLCWHGYHSIRREPLRLLAELPFARTVQADSGKLRLLMERLNAPLPVGDEEVEMVLAAAEVVGDGTVRRPELIRGLGAWYAHVERAHTPLGALLRAGVGRCLPAQEHHVRVMSQFGRLAPLVSQVSQRASTASQRLPAPLEPPDAARASAGASLACHVALLVALHAALVVVLVLPSGFFAWLIWLGCAHGSARCRFDLDSLLVWYGALGIAMLAVGCADLARGPRGSCAGWALRGLLLALPWVGASWTLQLSEDDVAVCGLYMSRVSGWVWGAALAMEAVLLCLLCRGVLAVCRQEAAARARAS